MFKYFLQGFLFGLAYVAPIGMQNLYVINTAIIKNRFIALRTAFVTIFFDCTLALGCFFGMGLILQKFLVLKDIMIFIGCVAIVYIGISLIKSVPKDNQDAGPDESFIKIVSHCFFVTWLNPQAIIDGTLLLGGIRATLSKYDAQFFIIGTLSASLLWFSSISTIVSFYKHKFNHKIIKAINLVCGFIILIYGIKLAYSLILDFIKIFK